MIGASGCAAFTSATIAFQGLDAPARKLALRQRAGPAIEDLHRVGTGVELGDQMSRHRLARGLDQPAKLSGSR